MVGTGNIICLKKEKKKSNCLSLPRLQAGKETEKNVKKSVRTQGLQGKIKKVKKRKGMAVCMGGEEGEKGGGYRFTLQSLLPTFNSC